MAIVFDAATSNAGSLTFAHAVGSGNNRILIVAVGLHNSGSISSVTYNGVSMTLAKSQNGTWRLSQIYYLVNPASGSNNVVITGLCSYGIAAVAVSFTGVHQTTPIVNVAGGNGSSYTPSLLITSSVGSVVLDSLVYISSGTSSAFAPGADQTERGDTRAQSTGSALGVTTKEGAASVTMNQTVSGVGDYNYAYSAVSIEMAIPPELDESFSVNDVHTAYNSELSESESFSVNDVHEGHVVFEKEISESFSVNDSNNKTFVKTEGESFGINDTHSVVFDAGTAALAHCVVTTSVPFPTLQSVSGIHGVVDVETPFPSCSALSGNYSVTSLAFPLITASAHLSILIDGNCKVPFPRISAQGSIVTFCSVNATIGFTTISASAHDGGANSVEGDITFPQFIGEASVNKRFDSTILKFTEK